MIQTEPKSSERVKIVGYRPAPDGRSLELTYQSGGARRSTASSRDRTGRARRLRYAKATLVLARPRRECKVVDGTSGKCVRRGGIPRL